MILRSNSAASSSAFFKLSADRALSKFRRTIPDSPASRKSETATRCATASASSVIARRAPSTPPPAARVRGTRASSRPCPWKPRSQHIRADIGRSASSNSPCTVPSSPNVPCRTGNTTSISGFAPGSGRIGAGTPAAVFPDQITDHFVPLGIHRGDHRFSRHQRDFMLAAAAAVNHRHPRLHVHRIFFPIADRISSTASSAVRFTSSITGFTSTTSIETILPGVADHFHREMRLAIRRAAAHRRAHAGRVLRIDEIHIERKMKPRRAVAWRCAIASPITARMPRSSISRIVNARTPVFRTVLRFQRDPHRECPPAPHSPDPPSARSRTSAPVHRGPRPRSRPAASHARCRSGSIAACSCRRARRSRAGRFCDSIRERIAIRRRPCPTAIE